MPIFDFHVHPALKAQMSDPATPPTPWDIVKIQFANPTLLTRLMKCGGINEVLDSQASLTQLLDGGVNLIGLALHPPETAMVNAKLMMKMAEQEQTKFINLERVREIASGDIYFQMLNEELANLQNHLSQGNRNLKIIKKHSDYDPSDMNTIHAVFILEGPHAFYGVRHGKTEDEIWLEFWANFESFNQNQRLLSMNLAHLQPNDFCNHAFGIQIFDAAPFLPIGNGISQHGFKMLRQLEQKGIMLDIKHMSLFARRQLYQYRLGDNHLPIICTHAGLTGIEFEKRKKYFSGKTEMPGGFLEVRHYKPAGYLPGTSFNASSINLYDEDVKEIIFSGGLIGLSFDQRILGFPDEIFFGDQTDDIFDTEVLSAAEKDFFTSAAPGSVSVSEIFTVDDILRDDLRDFPDYHARHFMNILFHFFVIADKYNINRDLMAKSICIGSDFDGLVNPIDCCLNVTHYDNFKKRLVSNFKAWEDKALFMLKTRISSFIEPAALINQVFFENANNFLQRNLT
jgi:microsomal dipeptidase-like Zn-dependent dipeptidase